ncbi:MAG TPA: hypothetical protein VN690_03305 [Terriglobales bacterium]|nr:hypothetical protein [Terriglobales bacterium]
MTNEAVSPRPGDLVLVRQRRWLVECISSTQKAAGRPREFDVLGQ